MRKFYEEISDEELKALTGAIKTRYGIDFTNYESKSLKRGFGRVMSKNGMKSLIDLWSVIMKDRDFLNGCIDDLTVNLTELFRNPDFWTKLHDDIIPGLKYKSTLNIWHAGCSTGEEVYSMAAVLYDKNMLHRTSAWATDLCSAALAQAMEAKYSATLLKKYEKSLVKYLPHKSMDDMFRLDHDKMIVKDKFKKHIDFHQHNLVQDPVQKKFDIIFCRNVMIYFDEKLKIEVLQKFHNALEADGYLIIGYYDMLPEESKKIFKLHDSKTRVYKKIFSDKHIDS